MKQRNVEFTDIQPAYRYLKQNNNLAEIYIYKKIAEDVDEENNPIYIYDMNIFKVDSTEITEENIASNPEIWIDYKSTEYSDKERIDANIFQIKYLVMHIKMGKMTLEDVPESLRAKVENELNKQPYLAES